MEIISLRQLVTLLGLTTIMAIAPLSESWAAMVPPEVVATLQASNTEQSIDQFLDANIIYLGERHDSIRDHDAQLDIIQSLVEGSPRPVAIAMEMFQRPFQPVLDQFIAREISEAQLLAQSEYETRWGFPWDLYAPILRYAQAQQISVLALNAPSETVSKVARQGLESIAEADLIYIPPVSELDLSNEDYRNFVLGAFNDHGQHHGDFDFDHFFAAQVIWDETMAQAITDFHQQNPDTIIITLAGMGHVMYGHGIPDRVTRRLGEDLRSTIVLLNPTQELTTQSPAIADLFWWSKPSEP